MKKTNAFTLLELLVTLAVVGVFAIILAPNFSLFIHKTQARTKAQQLLSIIQYARSEAVMRDKNVSICDSHSQLTNAHKQQCWQGIIVAEGKCQGVNSEVIRVINYQPNDGKLCYQGFPNASSLTYLPTGMSSGNGTFSYYQLKTSNTWQWRVIINHAGRARLESWDG